jgi:uncharacterized protein YgiM (DUF1202 family)
MKPCHLFGLFVLVGLCLASCAGPAPTSQPNATATLLARATAVAPTVSLNPTAGSVNTRVTITGSGFPAESRVGLYVGPTEADALQNIYAVAIASLEGKVTLAFVVPEQWPNDAPVEQDEVFILGSEDLSLKAQATMKFLRPTAQPAPTRPPAAPSGPTATPSGPTAFVNVDSLNLRSGPGADYDLVSKLNRNQSMSLLGRNGESTWARVRVPGGAEGWVSTQYITTTVPLASLPVIQTTSPTPTRGPVATPALPAPTPGQPLATTAPAPAGEQDKAVAAAISFYAAWANGNLDLALQYVSKPLADQIRADNSLLIKLLGTPSRPRYTRIEIQKFNGTTAAARATLQLASGDYIVDTMLVKQEGFWVIDEFQPAPQ